MRSGMGNPGVATDRTLVRLVLQTPNADEDNARLKA